MEVEVIRIEGEEKKRDKDTVAEEVFLAIHFNGKELVKLSCSPDNLKELSVGFVYSRGLIQSAGDIEKVELNEAKRSVHIDLKDGRTGRGGRGKAVKGAIRVPAAKISELMKSFQERSAIFKKTGGVHSAALSDGKNILVFQEDIGRQNALDKVIGEALLKNMKLRELIVLTTGRVSSEILFKIRKTGSPLIVSRSAPTDEAVRQARKWNMTLVGFARGGRMNIYSGGERII